VRSDTARALPAIDPLPVSRRTHRRYVLGLQGLWPGRRWAGVDGLRTALRSIGTVQVDPLNVIARSHELALAARVDGFRPADLDRLLYHEREFFDYGGTVCIWPMSELPYFRVAMGRRAEEVRWASFAAEHGEVIDGVTAQLRDRGPMAARDFPGRAGPGSSFRSRRPASMALYYLWLTGELMTHNRRRFDRIYYFTDQVAPAVHQWRATDADAAAFFIAKAIDYRGICSARVWKNAVGGLSRLRMSNERALAALAQLLESKSIVPVAVEGRAEVLYTAAERVKLLAEVEDGRVPEAWQVPAGASTTDEATLLAPLDIVSSSGRALLLFGFEYLWEVYKPAVARRWGYYTMPVLYGDELVARIDPKLDREQRTVVLNGLWLEDDGLASDAGFAAALGRALGRLAGLVGACQVDLSAVGPAALRRELAAHTGLR
jgi:uncharacterized protein